MQKIKVKMRRILPLLALFIFCSFLANAQQKTISGTVVDNNNEPVIGANIQVKGTSVGTASDVDGKFSLAVPEGGKTLVVSYIGFITQEVPIDKTSFTIGLKENLSQLDEVVVVGYGTMKKRDLTGAISSVAAKDIAAVPVNNVSEALAGKMAGVQVTTTEGSPDATIKIRVRGGGSITQSNEPLYIVDGFPVSSISDIAANDIASIDVLKDASSSAIYGSRGANGVIIITTKSGKEGKITVNYNAYYGWNKIAKELKTLSPYDFALFQYERQLLAGDNNFSRFFGNWQDLDMYQGMTGNNWQDIIFGNTGTTFNHNLSINGGTEKTKYMVSYNHIDQKAIMVGSGFTRDNLALRLTNNPVKSVQLDFSTRWSQTKVNGPLTNDGGSERGSSTDTRLKNAMIYPPIPVTGDLADPTNTDQGFSLYNPLVSLNDNNRDNKRQNLNMGGSASWEFINGFTLKTEVNLSTYHERNERFYGITTYYVRNNVPSADQMDPAITFTDINRQTTTNTNTLNVNFKKWMPKDHTLNLLLGQEYILTTAETLTAEIAGFDPSFDFDLARRFSNQGTALSTTNNLSPDDKLLSYFGRANYDYKSKYLLSATFRADGSSKFASNNRWGYFPSVAAAWRISSESFMESAKSWLSDLKLRASYGTAGNNNIPSGQIAQPYSSTTNTWINGYSYYLAPSKTMANPDLTWETTITRNIGLDLSLLNGKLNGTFDTYLNTTKNLLLLIPVGGTGYDAQYRNMGETQNKGLEATVNWTAIDKKNFGLTLGANISFNRNRINSLGQMNNFMGTTGWASTDIGGDFLVAVGQPIGEMIGYRSDGRYEVSDFTYNAANDTYTLKPGVVDCSAVVGTLRPGSMKLKDLNHDGKVTEDYADREVIGNANPKHTGGFNINFRVYGFDLAANFNWSYGNDIYNANKIEYTSTSKYYDRNMIDVMASGNRWTNLDMTTGQLITDQDALAAANANTTMWSPYMKKYVFSDWAVEDGSFLRLNTLTLGYTLPKVLTRKAFISTCRFYATGYNVFCLTKYSGFDPEVDTRRQVPYTPGVDYAAYPRSRQLVIGINLTF